MSGAPPLRIRLVMALLAWPIAFGLVLTLLTVFKHQLASMPLALRALVLSGALISVMATAVMPLLTVAVNHRLGGPATKR
jgi:antibiotic biosynthesis monooxygenase (ABM) superfamily enzyme